MNCVLNKGGHDNTIVTNDLNFNIEYNISCFDVITGQMRDCLIWWSDQLTTRKTFHMYAIPTPDNTPWFSIISVGY